MSHEDEKFPCSLSGSAPASENVNADIVHEAAVTDFLSNLGLNGIESVIAQEIVLASDGLDKFTYSILNLFLFRPSFAQLSEVLCLFPRELSNSKDDDAESSNWDHYPTVASAGILDDTIQKICRSEFRNAALGCFKTQNYAEAILLSDLVDSDFALQLRLAYLSQSSSPFAFLLQCIVSNDYQKLIDGSQLSQWRWVFEILCNHVHDTEAKSSLPSLFAERLKRENMHAEALIFYPISRDLNGIAHCLLAQSLGLFQKFKICLLIHNISTATGLGVDAGVEADIAYAKAMMNNWLTQNGFSPVNFAMDQFGHDQCGSSSSFAETLSDCKPKNSTCTAASSSKMYNDAPILLRKFIDFDPNNSKNSAQAVNAENLDSIIDGLITTALSKCSSCQLGLINGYKAKLKADIIFAPSNSTLVNDHIQSLFKLILNEKYDQASLAATTIMSSCFNETRIWIAPLKRLIDILRDNK